MEPEKSNEFEVTIKQTKNYFRSFSIFIQIMITISIM